MYMNIGRIIALALAFFLGVGLTAYRYFRTETASERVQTELSFVWQEGARVMAAGGQYEDISIFKASDGLKVTVIEGVRLKALSPELELANLTDDSAVQIVERKPIFGEKGEQVGEEIVGQTSFFANAPPHAFVFKTQGGWFRRVEGGSLKHVLALEKTLK